MKKSELRNITRITEWICFMVRLGEFWVFAVTGESGIVFNTVPDSPVHFPLRKDICYINANENSWLPLETPSVTPSGDFTSKNMNCARGCECVWYGSLPCLRDCPISCGASKMRTAHSIQRLCLRVFKVRKRSALVLESLCSDYGWAVYLWWLTPLCVLGWPTSGNYCFSFCCRWLGRLFNNI